MIKLDILAIGAHPDDVELACAGTLIKHVKEGKKVGILDLTQGELGTRGSAELRLKEAQKAAEIQGLAVRRNIGLADGFFQNDKENQMPIIEVLREFRPEIVLANAMADRHPDHGRGGKLASDACFLSGLRRIETTLNGEPQEAWRPKAVYHYIQDRYIKPDFVVDITEYWDQKMEAILAFSSQFYDPKSKEPSSPISSKEFLDVIKGRYADFGRAIGRPYAEGFTVERPAGIQSLFDIY